MLSKRQLAETVILNLGGGRASVVNHIDPRDVYQVIDMTGDELISMSVKEANDNDIDSMWVKTYTTILRYDVVRGQIWCQLPAVRIGLKKDADLRRVGWVQGTANWPIEPVGSARAFSLLQSGQYPPGVYPYTPEGDKMYFRTMPANMKGSKILISMIPAVSGYPEDEPLPLPEEHAKKLLDAVTNYFRQQTAPAKMTNDSNPNTK